MRRTGRRLRKRRRRRRRRPRAAPPRARCVRDPARTLRAVPYCSRPKSSKHNAKRTLARLEKRRLRALKKKQEEELERIREAQNANISKEGVRSCPPVVCVRARSSAPPARAARALARLTRPRCDRAQTERAKDKFAFLLAQTEIFAHFLSAGKDDSKKCALASAPAVWPRGLLSHAPSPARAPWLLSCLVSQRSSDARAPLAAGARRAAR